MARTAYGEACDRRAHKAHMRAWEKRAPEREAALQARVSHYQELEDHALELAKQRKAERES